ncbi:MAG: Co2+/Mg2+ efflux protein ApaG [Phycisphaeraceae bacterium]|nr:Co2+/Mg2+ efflux protein ApaG [Phycisphaerae bacterium]MBX3393194.1 Co2+/Mg2+ efflux protein ApaG [Phycisphaeraceae bacterium]HRJ50641.1 Co2+/Mg2+ efflux protein ApaG [Phycisphaerales bacterium]
MGKPHCSECVTEGVRVCVEPSYLPDHSDPDDRRFVFGYRVTITNEGPSWVKLMSRRWVIVDASGRRDEVTGDGVVGQQPELDPGQSFSYVSHCPLTKPWGTMEGAYQMLCQDGRLMEVKIDRFFLVAPQEVTAGA